MNDTDLPSPSGQPYKDGGPIPRLPAPGRPERLRPRPVLPDPFQPYTAELVAGPTGWQSVPGFVRVAVWLWALVTVLGFAIGLVWSVIWAIILMVTLGAQ